ncbi:type I restriction endonuclease subunit R [Acidithiobacillus sulfuriphilus]|uniref:Type I restriction enzyme endonuclease subunit n=2 Tax=Acidithiobacillus sulfuriphilus TaxID=1867749 RepID=A0A3M8RK94_9PROT|nr:HsdR family type I site-specific deoxyribonuclease [Acidithiobacillus sulfuriphilus]RNF69028.1 type I restriction endonuclease subunit R [Acidithiobacillus sulfuriphilus]
MSEYLHVEKPFLDQLAALGWTVVDQGQGFIPSDPAASLRGSFREWLLPEVFRETVRAINRTADGTAWLTDRQLDDLRDQILRQPNRTLLEANEGVQALFLKAQVERNEVTGESDPVVSLIDFAHPERNVFHAINQFRIDTPGCVKQCVIPDIVLFVNGIPLVVVEAKIGDANTANPMHAAFEQLLRYRNGRADTAAAGLREGEPRLFHTNLLLICTCGEKATYGSVTSGYEHFYAWKDIWPESNRAYTPPLGVEREQERLIQGLLAPATLLDVLRTCTVFMDTDSGKRVKVVSRYQQYRAAHRITERLRTGKTMEERSGVVWHTQGSGKSLTMVFVARMLRASSDLADFKILLVNDRVDLEDQLAATAKLIGGKVNLIESTAQLREHLATSASDINMVMVHKFMERAEALPLKVAEALASYRAAPSGQTFGVVNPSDRILLMIDEAHRTQSSDFGDNLFEAFPNATRIAFTGTPLITEQHGNRRTVKRFGEYIDTYKLMDAVHDGATLQILYEGRTADTALKDKHGFDTRFEDLFKTRSEAELFAIKKKYGASGDILEAEKRIAAIARDLVAHYIDNILPDGFKAQVVCHSKLAAIRYQKSIRAALAERLDRERLKPKPDTELIRRIAFLKAAVVVSSDATNELAVITEARREAKRWNAVENFCKPFDFDDPDRDLTGIAFLIVCDMLLTGFDAPVEQVMYIDKRLKEHNLLQAIARVNRVAKNKHRGFIVDYIGLANHLTQALAIYAQEDAQDIQQGLKSLLTELPILEERYQRLLQHFRAAGVGGIEAFVKDDLPTPEAEVAVVHAAVGALKDIKRRADFEVYLKKFLQSLNLILPNQAGHPYRGPARRFGYLLRMVKERYKDDSLDIADAGEKVKALINEHLIDLGINPRIPPIELLADDFIANVQKHAQGDPEAKASEMEHAIRKHCTVHFDEDPAFYKRLSEKLEKLIQEHQNNWQALAEGYEQIRNEAMEGRTDAIEGLSKEATTFYDYVVQLAFGGDAVPPDAHAPLKKLMARIVEILQGTIDIIDFWKKPIEVKNLRGNIDTEILLANIPQLTAKHERIAVEIVKLAEKRHEELTK